MVRGITSITYLDDLPRNTPATVNRRTGALYISRRKWNEYTPEQKLFILLHEMAHVVLQTTNEEAADNWAFEQYNKLGYSLKQSVYALTGILDEGNPQHLKRASLQLQRAQKVDNMAKIAPERLVDVTFTPDQYLAFESNWEGLNAFNGYLDDYKGTLKQRFENDKKRRRNRQKMAKKRFENDKKRRRLRRKNEQKRIKKTRENILAFKNKLNAIPRAIPKPMHNGLGGYNQPPVIPRQMKSFSNPEIDEV